MDTKQTNSDLNSVEENFKGMDQADASGSDTSYDFCWDEWDVGNVEKSVPAAENLIEPKSEGSVSDFDLCDEFGVFSAPESIKSSEADSEGTYSESESDDIQSNYSVGSMGLDMSSNEVTILPKKLQRKRETLFSFTSPETLYPEHMTDQEFKQMRLRDIVKEHALPFLPAKSLVRFRSVSKAWDHWIKNPFLAHKQSYMFQNTSGYFHERYDGKITYVSLSERAYGIQNSFFNFLPENLSIMSSCNGLLLCRTRDPNITYYVCNPATNEWKELPCPSYYHGEDPSPVLAFEASILNMEANYHIVCAFQLLDEPVLCFEIYSSETKTWKCVDSLCDELGEAILKKNGFYYNGVAYWETSTNEVLAFDLKNEVHGVLPLLDGLPAGGALSQMNGQISYVSACEMDIGIFEVSVFKAGIGGIMELEKCVSFELGWVSGYNHCQVLPSLSDDTVMLLVDGEICAVNLITKKVEVVMKNVNLDNAVVLLPYVNSLVAVA